MNQTTQKYLPAEWANQKFVQLTWPHSDTDWKDVLHEAISCFVNIAHEILKHELLIVICANRLEVEQQLVEFDETKVKFVELPTNDTWARDHGGITVFENGKAVVYDFTFNGWGLKFPANHDNQITGNLFYKNIFYKPIAYKNCLNFVLEGGSIESDGDGTILTTSNCLLSLNRNNLSKSKVEKRLKNYFGLKRVLWLNHGYLAGDDTDSHIDTLARFCNSSTIAYVKCYDEEDEHFIELNKMEKELFQFRQLNGKPYKLIPLPMASPVYFENDRLPATYANFLIINNTVLMPTYNTSLDVIAKSMLQEAFPERKIVGIDCSVLIKQHGSLHCVTMQYPENI